MSLRPKHLLVAAGLIAGAWGVARLLRRDKPKRRNARGAEETGHDATPLELPVVLGPEELAELVRNHPSRLIIDIQPEQPS